MARFANLSGQRLTESWLETPASPVDSSVHQAGITVTDSYDICFIQKVCKRGMLTPFRLLQSSSV